MSQTVLYRKLKYDGSVNYEWETQLEFRRGSLVILTTREGTAYRGRSPGTFRFPMRTHLWTDRWFNVNQIYAHSDGRGVMHYIDAGMPATFEQDVASFIDLDLDLEVDSGWNVLLLDEDEYESHRAKYGYPPRVLQQVEQAMRAAREKVAARAWPFGTSVESARLRVRPFFWSDLAAMDAWGGSFTPFDDPWIIPAAGTPERADWYAHYIETSVTRLYAIETLEGGEMIGHISLRDVMPGIESRLGIGLAPERLSLGYGTEALRAFLDYYFDVLGFQRMVLDVAATNERATRSYERLGFQRTGEHHRGYGAEAQWRVLDRPQYFRFRKFFRQTPWGVQQLFYDMELRRESWEELRRTETLQRRTA